MPQRGQFPLAVDRSRCDADHTRLLGCTDRVDGLGLTWIPGPFWLSRTGCEKTYGLRACNYLAVNCGKDHQTPTIQTTKPRQSSQGTGHRGSGSYLSSRPPTYDHWPCGDKSSRGG